MSFIAKNPLTIPEIATDPNAPQTGVRGLFAGEDGWYDIDSDGNINKIISTADYAPTVVYRPKGSCSTLPTTNNQAGDVWNLSQQIDVGSVTVQFTSNSHVTVPTNRMTYSFESVEGSYTHTLDILFMYGEFPILSDKNYTMIDRGMHSATTGISIIMEGISFDDINYETYDIHTNENGYVLTFTEYSQSSSSELQDVASEERTITQLKIPYTNKVSFPAGSNVVWTESCYWDVLSEIVDLSQYISLGNVQITDKNYSGSYIKHSKDIIISTKKAENLVTASEVDGVLSEELSRINSKLGGVFHYKGSTNTLPKTNNQIGDVWNLSSDIAVGELTVTTITTTPFTLPASKIGYRAAEELDGNREPTGYYYHHIYITVNKESVNLLPDDEWYIDEIGMPRELKVVISGFSPLYYGGTVQGLNIGVEQEYDGEEIIFTAVILDRTTIPLITEWQELASSGGQVELVSMPYHNIVKFNKGDNLAWAEPGYWDTISNTVDLSPYVKTIDYAAGGKAGVVRVRDNGLYGLFMSSGYIQISPATSAEIAAKAHGYKPIVPARIEDAVKAGTHQSMSDSYNVGTKGGLPASYTAVKNYVNNTINKKLTGAYKIMGSIDTSELEIDCDLPSIGASKGDVYNIKSGTLNSYYLTDYTTAAGEVLHTSTLSTTSTTFTRRYPYGLLTLIPYLEHSSSVYLYAGGYDGGNWDSDKVVTAEFDSYDYDEDTEVLTITFKNLSKTFEPTSPNVYVVSVCDIFFNLKLKTGDNVVWTSYGWDKLASDVDLSAYATTAYVDSLVGGLEDEIDEILEEGV